MRRILLIVTVCVLIVAGVLGLSNAKQKNFPTGHGDEWMNLDPKARELVILGFLAGYNSGRNSACDWAHNVFTKEGEPVHDLKDTVESKCLIGTPKLTELPSFYAAILEHFYESYPNYRRIPPYFLMERLYDGSIRSPEQLYKLVQSGAIKSGY
jgi:hypothetical protein